MNPRRLFVSAICLLLLMCGVGRGAESPVTNANFSDGLKGWQYTRSRGDFQIVADPDQADGKMLRITMDEKYDGLWKVQLRQKLNASAAADKPLYVVLVARSPDNLSVRAAVQLNDKPWTELVADSVKLTPQWQKIDIGGTTRADAAAGKIHIALSLASGRGEIDIREVQVEGEALGAGPAQTESKAETKPATKAKPKAPATKAPQTKMPQNVDHALTLTNGDFSQGLQHWTAAGDQWAEYQVVDVDGQSFTKALRIHVKQKPEQPWKVQVRQVVGDSQISFGQQVSLTAMVRSDAPVNMTGGLQLAKPPYSVLAGKKLMTTTDWQKVEFIGRTNRSGSGPMQVTFGAGFATGVVEIADVQLTVTAPKPVEPVALEDLPIADFHKLAPDQPALPGGEHRSIIGDLDKLRLMGAQYGHMEWVDVKDPRFDRAARITTTKTTQWYFNIQGGSQILRPVQKGDTMLAVFAWRCIQPNPLIGYASLGFAFEQAGAPYTKSVEWNGTAANDQWQIVMLPFTAAGDYGPKGAQVCFRAGYGEQAVEIASPMLIDFGPDVKVDDLPRSGFAYGGYKPNAPWRAAAAARIEKYRKGDLHVRVVDANGKPVTDAKVHVAMQRHAYGFGSALSIWALPGGRYADDAKQYFDNAAKLFNWGVIENGMKWPFYSRPGVPAQVEQLMSWMENQGWSIRGHNLIWPGWRRNAPFLAKMQNDPDKLRQTVREHVHDMAAKFAGRLVAWDVINEPYKNHDIMDVLGDDEMAEWFKAAKAGDPHATLMLNDFLLLSDPSPDSVKVDYYLKLIDHLRSLGAPVEGIGFQSHFGGQLTPIPLILKRCEKFAAKDLKLQVTELDINVADEKLQATYLRDFMTAVFSEPATEAIVMWGFWDGATYQHVPALFRQDWSMRPSGKAYLDLVKHQWWTDVKAATNAEGRYDVRGFLGDYVVTAERNGATAEQKVKLTRDGADVTIQLKAD